MKENPIHRTTAFLAKVITAFVLLIAISPIPGMAGEPQFFGLLKGQMMQQTNAGPAVPDGPSNFVFQAFADLGHDELTERHLYLPTGGEVFLGGSEDHSDDEYRQSFASSGARDAAFPNGVYLMVLSTAGGGTHTNQLALTGDLYPSVPTINNFAAAQSIDPAASFTLSWNPIDGGTSNDFIQVQIADCHGERVWESGPPGAPGSLNGTASSIQIAARRLRPGQKYDVELMVVRFASFDTNSQPGAIGVAGYFMRTKTWLTTSGTPTDCPFGRLELLFQYPTFPLGSSTQGVVSFPQTLVYQVLNFSVDGRDQTNFPASVLFTGPGGVGWNNETNQEGHQEPWFAWYGSRAVSVPPFPSGGIYTVGYDGTPLRFNLLNPDAANQQVLLVPTAIVDAEGLLTEIRWVYHATDGSILSPRPFMDRIIVRVEASEGNNYDAMSHGSQIPPTESRHLLMYPIPWSMVRRIEIGFRDLAGNQFLSQWMRESAEGLMIVTRELPSGSVGSPYGFILLAQGGTPPRRWSVASESWPPNIVLDPETGTLTGVPPNPGVYPFAVRVTDAVSNSVVREFSLMVQGEGGPEIGSTPNLRELLLIKGLQFVQTNAAGAVPASASNVLFRASVSLAGPSSITNGALRLPGGSIIPFESGDHAEDGDDAAIDATFASISALDARFPNGTYDFILDTANDGRLTNSLTLTGNSYPATPRISNFLAAQAVNPTNSFTLSWDALAGAMTNDLIFVEIRDCRDREVFNTPGPGQPGALVGTATSVVIPGRTLRPGQRYSVQMIVGRVIGMGDTVPPGGRKLAAYVKQTTSKLSTMGPPTDCPLGELRLSFTFRPGTFNGTRGITSYPQDIVFYTAQFSMEPPPNSLENVTFSGPPGSGLNNSAPAHSYADDRYAWFSSVYLSTPPYPPGGIYSVNLNGTPFPHTLPDPNIAAQKILLVPNVVEESGEVTEVNWTYRNASGAIVGPQPFMRRLQLRLNGPNGPLNSGDYTRDLLPPATNVLIDPPILWSAVTSVEIGFEDAAGNEFKSDWQRASPEVQIITFALPGAVVSNTYHGVLSAFGGTPPYAWSVASGSLPSGLTLNGATGEITGAPREVGPFEVRFRVNDNTERSAERSFTIHVRPPGPDVSTYVVAKGRRYHQTNSSPPSPAIPGFQFLAFVNSGIPGGVESATLELPGGSMRTLNHDFDRFQLEESFSNSAGLDAAFANGVYTFHLNTVHDGVSSPALRLTNNAFPAPLRVANWPAAQAIDPTQGFFLTWDPIPGGNSNDLIVVSVSTESGDEIFGTPGFLEPNRLDGTRANIEIPSGILDPGTRHHARLLIARPSTLDTNSLPGVPGVAGYFTETTFGLATLNPAGQIQFGARTYTTGENAGVLRLPVLRTGGSTGSVAVDVVRDGGSASSETDFAIGSTRLEFASGVSSNSVAITILDDELLEAPETIRLVLRNVTGGAGLGFGQEAIVTIMDDDAPPGVNVEFYIVAKGQSFLQFGPGAPTPASESPFFFGAFSRAAFEGGLIEASIVNPAGVTNQLETEDDGGRHFNLFSEYASKAALDAAFNRGVYTFQLSTAGDGLRTPSINLPGDTYPNVPRLSNWPAAQTINTFADYTLTLEAFAGGSAEDFILVSLRDTNTFETVFETPDLLEPGALNGTATAVTIPSGRLQPGRSYECELLYVNVVVVNAQGYPGAKGIGAYARQTQTMVGTATPPPAGGQIQFAEGPFLVSETNETATVSLVRLGGSQGEVSVVVSATNGTATAGADFTGTTTVVSFADGATNANFSFPILDDTTFEGPEAVRLVLRQVTGDAALGGRTNAVVTIIDNELPPTPGSLQFSVTTANSPENSSSVTLTVTRAGGSAGEVTVDYETDDGSAEAGNDYVGDAGTLVFAPGVTSRTITLEIIPDALDESNEVFTVTLANPSNGATLTLRSVATVVLTDDDAGGLLTFSLPEYRISENGEEATITVRRTGGTAEGVTVDYLAVADSAEEDADFAATSGTLTFEAGDTEGTFVVPILDDFLPEGNEVLRLTLSNPTGGAMLGRITNAPLSILDDEVFLQFARVAYTNNETGPQAILTVVRTGPSTEEVSVEYATDDDTAFADEDYVESTGTITLAAGASSKTITVPIVNDGLVEDGEAFTVSLFNPTGAQLGDDSNATVHIVDNDFGGTIAFSSAVANARENGSVVSLTVVRAGGRAGGVTVDFTVTDGSAEDGEDYTATNGTLTFAEGVTRLTIPVPILDDALDEENETFTVQLSNPTAGAELGEIDEVTVSIADNDVAGTLRFAATAYQVSETGGVATVTVLRSGGKAGGVTVDYATSTGTATPGADYTETTGTLTFAANETSRTFQIPIATDDLPDGNKTVLLSLSNAGGGARLLTPTNATLNIIDSVGSVQFASATYTVSEAGRSVVLTVTRSGPPGTLTVNYATANFAAASPGDYRAKTGVITFSGTTTSRTITIPIVNDTLAESEETFTVTLNNPSAGAQFGERRTATVTIIDNDGLDARANRR